MPSERDLQELLLADYTAVQLLEAASREDFSLICRIAATHFNVPQVAVTLLKRDQLQMLSEQTATRTSIQELGTGSAPDYRPYDALCIADAIAKTSTGLRPCVGVALRSGAGHIIGCLFVVDKSHADISTLDKAFLRSLSTLVIQQCLKGFTSRQIDTCGHMPTREHMDAELASLVSQYPNEPRVLVLVDALDTGWAHYMTLAMGLAPFRSIIREMANRLIRLLDGRSRVYQVGVKRFAFLMHPGIDNQEGFLDRLLDELRQPMQQQGIPIPPTVCAGAFVFRLHEDCVEDSIRKAMYGIELAHNAGKAWMFYDPVADCAYRRSFSLVSDISRAMTNNELHLVFQPRFNIEDGLQVSAEVLLRWNHPRLGAISPAEFIPVLEKNQLIHLVTHWVVDTALAGLSRWPQGVASKLSLNLSAQDFKGYNVDEMLLNACIKNGIDPARIEVEITEGEWLKSSPQILQQLRNIRDLGIDLAIDDFGTGYSNFAYLREIPANVLKLDKSLILNLDADMHKQVIVSSIIKLAQQLQYRAVADGVETYRCLKVLRSLGCDEAQGFFLAHPMNEVDFVANSGYGVFFINKH